MKKILFAISILLFACSQQKDPTSSEDLIEEEKLDGSISGQVTEVDGTPIEGIAVTTSPDGYTSTTDFAGRYKIPKIEEGVYDILFEGGVTYADTIIVGVELLEDQDLEGIDAVLRNELNSTVDSVIKEYVGKSQNRDIIGNFTGDVSKVKKVEVFSTDTTGAVLPTSEASISNNGIKYSVTSQVPQDGGILVVYALDSLGNRIGITSYPFDVGSGEISIPAFKPINALPTIAAKDGGSVSINDTMKVYIDELTKDTLGVPAGIAYWEISWNKGAWQKVVGDTAYSVAPDKSGEVYWQARVTDNDSNTITQQENLITVFTGEPTVSISGVSELQVNVETSFTATVTDNGTITKYEWDFGSGFVTGTKSALYTWSSIGTKYIKLRVTDDDGNSITVDRSILVNSGVTTVTGFNDTTISVGTELNYQIQVSDADGVQKVEWDFGHGTSGFPQVVTTTDPNVSNVSHLFDTFGNYTVILKVYDIYGEITEQTKIVKVAENFIDARDGNIYTKVQIGEQIWMGENLRYLPQVDTIGTSKLKNYFVPNFNPISQDEITQIQNAKATSEYNSHGVLYNWGATMDDELESTQNPSLVTGVCPSGWHIPSIAEWNELKTFIRQDKSIPSYSKINFSHLNSYDFNAEMQYIAHTSTYTHGYKYQTSENGKVYEIHDSQGLDSSVGWGFGYPIRCIKN